MISFNDILAEGTRFQGPLLIVAISYDGKFSDVYEGDGDDVPLDAEWGDGYVSFIYYDSVNKCITVEIEEDE